MKAIWKRIICIFIVLVILMSLGCAQSEKGKQDNKSPIKGGSLPTSLDNTDVSILFWEGFEKEWFYEPIKTFEEKYNGKVNIIETLWSEIESKIVTLVSAGDSPDIIFWNNQFMPKYAINQILQPLDEYIYMEDPVWDLTRDITNQFKYKGKHYGVATFPTTWFIYYNKTLFENNGIKTPIDYYKEGTWDWNTLEQVAKVLTQDTDRDGQTDQWGLYMGELGNPVYSNNGDIIEYENDGNISLTIMQPPVVEALQFLQDAVVKHKYMPANMNLETAFFGGKVAMVVNRVNLALSAILPKKAGEIKFEWDIVPYPKSPTMEKPIYAANTPHWGIASGAKNPEGAAVLLYLRQKNENENYSTYLKQIFNDEQIALIFEMAKSTKAVRHTGIGNMMKIYNQMVKKDIFVGKPVTTSISENIPLLQAEIDMTLSKSN